MRITWVFLILSLILATTLSQDSGESEETGAPKKVLRKYRVRRPAPQAPTPAASSPAADSAEVNPPAVKNKPRIRRVRVKQQRPVLIEATPQNLLSSRYGNAVNAAPAPAPAPVPVQAIQPQQQQVYFEDQQIVDPVRVVPNYRQATPSSTRTALLANVNLRDRDHEDNKKPTVGTTRNYSHINEDGSFTFGYESEDGSFKEETRGTDCVVRGKYGYVDPSGVRREFAYVSGNPCDPNDPNKGELQDEEDDDEESIVHAKAGIRQRIPIDRRPLINSNVQQALEQTAEERVPEEQIYSRPILRRVRVQAVQPQPSTPRPDTLQPTTFRPRIRITQAPPTSPVPEAVFRAFPQFRQPISTLSPRPALQEPNQDLSEDRTIPERAFNFQQELQEIAGPNQLQYVQQPQQQQQPEVAAQQQQQIQYRQVTNPQQYRTPDQHQYNIHNFPQRQHFGSRANSIFQSQPEPEKHTEPQTQQRTTFGRYRTELVYDPNSGQYTNYVVQEAPKSGEEFTLTQRLRAFADPQRPEQLHFQPYEQPQLQYYQQPTFNQFGQQYQFQQPFQQYSAQSPQTAAATQTIMALHPEAQQISNSAASGQIDAFLRTLNLPA